MLEAFLQTTNKKIVTKYALPLKKIQTLGNQYLELTNNELKSETFILRKRLSNGEKQTDLIFEIFALIKEASSRVLNLRHYDVQLIGGFVLSEMKIAEMKTGEGKTIVALLPTFLNALTGNGSHVITVNDYLARRDAELIGKVHRFLGLSVGLIQENMSQKERKQNYNCDVVYVTNNELGFDYLRDNMAFENEEVVLKPLYFAVVDEVDSILIDESRTPLIISGTIQTPTKKYLQTSKIAAVLKRNVHYNVDEKNQNVILIEEGTIFCEKALNLSDLYNPENPWIPYILNSIKAKELYKLNTNYIINSQNKIIIVDEFTGRTMADKRWGDGLHQAVEAKESVKIQDESETLASITYQSLFLLYNKLSGMTGTAKTEELEFEKFYKLKVIRIPTQKATKRKDFSDLIYKNQFLKWQAITAECAEVHKLGRPILVGTATIKNSELLAALFKEFDIPYQLLNARPENVIKESEIVAQAGCLNSITISTNMSGRGTDIILGGNPKTLSCSIFKSHIYTLINSSRLITNFFKRLNGKKVDYKTFYPFYNNLLIKQKNITKINKFNIIKLGGLHVIGTERHESRRIDNQLRGRSGRQGDPGSSKFFLSLDDKILRLFGGNQILNLMQNIGYQEYAPIQSPLLNQALESAQRKVEAYYFDIRKQMFEYDQVLTLQRNLIYNERRKILESEKVFNWIIEYAEKTFHDLLLIYKNLRGNNKFLKNCSSKIQGLLAAPFKINFKNNLIFLQQQVKISYDLKETEIESIKEGLMKDLGRIFVLQQIDLSWKEHLQRMSLLRDCIRWRIYGQKNPLTEYKKEAFDLFINMLIQIRQRGVYFVLRSKILVE